MVTKVSQKTEVKAWLRANIGQVRLFRVLREEAITAADVGKRTKADKKIKRIQGKIEDLVVRGKSMGLSEDQIRRINLEITEMTRQGESIKTIKEKLEEGL